MKSLRSTLILLLIVAVVGGYIYFNERGPVAVTGSIVLLRTDPARVETIRLSQPMQQDIVLVKDGKQWKVRREKLPALPADPDAVKSLLDSVQLLQAPSALPNTPEKLREYGLDKPRSTLRLEDATLLIALLPIFSEVGL